MFKLNILGLGKYGKDFFNSFNIKPSFDNEDLMVNFYDQYYEEFTSADFSIVIAKSHQELADDLNADIVLLEDDFNTPEHIKILLLIILHYFGGSRFINWGGFGTSGIDDFIVDFKKSSKSNQVVQSKWIDIQVDDDMPTYEKAMISNLAQFDLTKLSSQSKIFTFILYQFNSTDSDNESLGAIATLQDNIAHYVKHNTKVEVDDITIVDFYTVIQPEKPSAYNQFCLISVVIP